MRKYYFILGIIGVTFAISVIGLLLYRFTPTFQRSNQSEIIPMENSNRFLYWYEQEPMRTARQDLVVAALDGEIYALGGLDGANKVTDVVEIYSPLRNQWRIGPSLPESRYQAAAATVAENLYLIGGLSETGKATTDVFVFNKTTQSWSRGASLPRELAGHQAAVWEGKIYVVGGYGEESLSTDIFVFDPQQGSWQNMASLPVMRNDVIAGFVQDDLFVASGNVFSTTAENRLDIYDASLGEWSQANIPFSRKQAVGGGLGEVFVITGGKGETGAYADVEIFDTLTRLWITITPMPTARYGAAATTIDDRMYFIGGSTGSTVSSANNVLELIR
ncbi:MAG: kelch repeat-containing protein [Patescibacteria group bacterium]